MDNMEITLVAMEAQYAADREPGDLIAKVRAAMKSAANHWMVLDKEKQFRGAIAGLVMALPEGSADRVRVEHEIKALRRLSALISASQAGLSVDLASLVDESDGPIPEPIGLTRMWNEVSQ